MRKLHIASLSCTLLICSLLAGCAVEVKEVGHQEAITSQQTLREYWQQWLSMRHSPLELSGPWVEQVGMDPADHTATMTWYGDYAVISWEDADMALLLDDSGQAIWAGSQVLPLCRDRKPAMLLLLRRHGYRSIEGHGDVIETIHFLNDFDAATHSRLVWQDAYRIPGADDSYRQWGVVDIDLDGTDELVGASYGVGYSLAYETELRWDISVHEQYFDGPLENLFGDEDEPSEEDDEDLEEQEESDFWSFSYEPSLEWKIQSYLSIPIDVPPSSISFRRTGLIDTEIELVDHSVADQEDPSRERILGVIERDSETGKFVFIPHEDVAEDGD